MGAARDLGDHLVDDPQLDQILGGHLHGLSGLAILRRVAPEDRRAAFRADHRVDRELQHVDAVADAERQRPAAAAFAGDGHDDRHGQLGHLAQVVGDGLGLAPLLGADAGVGAGRVDEGDDRPPELLGLAHEAERLAVALGVGHAEVAPQVLLHVAALLLADDHDGRAAQARPPPDDGLVVAEVAVPVQLDPVGEDPLDVVEGVRALRVARDVHLFQRLQVLVRAPLQLLQLAAEDPHLIGHVDAPTIGEIQKLVDLRLDLDDVALEIQMHGDRQLRRGLVGGPRAASLRGRSPGRGPARPPLEGA